MLIRLAPALFVLLWSTGFLGTKLGSSGAEPFSFLVVRVTLVLALLIPLGWWIKAPPLNAAQCGHAMVVGILMYTTYLGGVMWAMRAGMASNVAALIVSLQPVLTAALAGIVLKEVISPRHWIGIALGLAGAALVIGPRLEAASASDIGSGITPATVVSATLALLGITVGTIYQKRFASGFDLVSGAIWQYIGALATMLPVAFAFETGHIEWTPGVIGALAWLVLVLSIGATGLLMMLIRENAVSRTSGLFYLVPGVTAVMSWAMLDETLTMVQLVGLVVVTVAVVLMQPAKPVPLAPQ